MCITGAYLWTTACGETRACGSSTRLPTPSSGIRLWINPVACGLIAAKKTCANGG